MEATMPKIAVIAAVGALMLVGVVFMVKSTPTGATSGSPPGLSSFELMSNTKDLPVAPVPDAF
jgi:hypothetical protein